MESSEMSRPVVLAVLPPPLADLDMLTLRPELTYTMGPLNHS